ncbi:Mor transcription activator family protein [uncultured Pseudacidovorax sp.]|uniref:Mor transcription activator family protein n=1 Tax=uncultured Pseudacidovorax sp. TaxID=679313 RepID=UPI0025F1180A|nr:Mor transcription activator family protein [uncultured Pseudacidovorax sp.]
MNMKNPLREDALSVIQEEAQAVAVTYGAAWCEQATEALLLGIVSRLGGCQVYVPRQSFAQRTVRDAKILARFDGTNIQALAREFQTSERTIRRVLIAHRSD